MLLSPLLVEFSGIKSSQSLIENPGLLALSQVMYMQMN